MSISNLTSSLRALVMARLAAQVVGVTAADRHAKRWQDTWRAAYAGPGVAILLYIDSAATQGDHILDVTIGIQVEENVGQNLSPAGTGIDGYSWAEEVWAAIDKWAPSDIWTAFDAPSLTRIYDDTEAVGYLFTARTRTGYGVQADT